MTPVYDLNQPSSSFPIVELDEDDQHLQLFLSPPHHHHAASSSFTSPAAPTFFTTAHQKDQRGSTKLIGESSLQHDHQDDKYISHSRSSNHKLFSSTSDNIVVHKLPSCKREDEGYCEGSSDGSSNWLPPKMRMMKKMMNFKASESDTNNKPVNFTLKFQDHHQKYHPNNNSSYNNNSSSNNSTIRFCSDCNTTTTPLWRSGPRGPKSLCNACGIRQRKARRAMAAAASMENGAGRVIGTETSSSSSTKTKVKEKKSRTSHMGQCKKSCKPLDHPPYYTQAQKTKISFKNLAFSLSNNSALQRVFPQDVEQAALLLMELSCGFIQS